MLANIGNSRNQVLLSTNGGASFADITPNLATYNNIAVSPDGTRLYCAKVGNNATNVNDDVIYVSFNDGATWSATFTQNQRRISALNATDDSVIFCRFNNATDAFQGVFRSTDNGTTQTLISSSANFRGVYASGDESLIMIFSILQTDTLLVSLNQGTSFSNFTLPASVTTIRLTSSYDGQRAMIGTSTRLYVSTDKMTSVTESQPAGNVDRTWQAAATLS